MVIGGSWWFFGGYRCLLVAVGGNWWLFGDYLVSIGGYLVGIGVYWWLSVVIW